MVNLQVLAAGLRRVRALGMPEALPVGDWQGRRSTGDAMSLTLAADLPIPPEVTIASISMLGEGGHRIPARLYRVRGADARACVVYVHGGGMIMGTLDGYDSRCARYAALARVPVIAIDYRLAPENPFPAGLDDVVDAIRWVHSHADELGIDARLIAIAGDSAGAGIAAGAVLRLRDEGGPALACQLLVYPMLDDRTTAPEKPSRLMTWTADDNATGWGCLLGPAAGGPDVSPYAAPARATDLTGLPPTFIESCTLDLFLQEDEEFATRLAAAGADVEYHVRKGVPHGYELLAPRSRVTERAWRERSEFLIRHLGVSAASIR